MVVALGTVEERLGRLNLAAIRPTVEQFQYLNVGSNRVIEAAKRLGLPNPETITTEGALREATEARAFGGQVPTSILKGTSAFETQSAARNEARQALRGIIDQFNSVRQRMFKVVNSVEVPMQQIFDAVKAQQTTTQTPGVLASPSAETQGGSNVATFQLTDPQGNDRGTTDDSNLAAQFVAQGGTATPIGGGGGGGGGFFQVGGNSPPTREEILALFTLGPDADGATRAETISELKKLGFKDAAITRMLAAADQPPAGFIGPELTSRGPGFEQGPDRTFEEIFGETGRRAQVTEFLGNQFPGRTRGTFNTILEGFREPINRAFTANTLLGGGGILEDFLGTLGGVNPRISEAQFGQLGGLFERGPEAAGLTDIQRSAIEPLASRQGQRSQFNLLAGQRQRDLPFDLRAAFGRLADRRFDEILTSQGDLDFQILPHIQRQGLFG